MAASGGRHSHGWDTALLELQPGHGFCGSSPPQELPRGNSPADTVFLTAGSTNARLPASNVLPFRQTHSLDRRTRWLANSMAIDPGIFTLKTAGDLLGKLERDFEALRARPTDSDACFNFFVTAEHLPEWHLGADAEAASRLRKGEAMLRVCSHIANGAKHFIIKESRHRAVAATHVGCIVSWDPTTGRTSAATTDGSHSEFFIECATEESKQLGPSISVTALAERILAFWREQLNRQ